MAEDVLVDMRGTIKTIEFIWRIYLSVLFCRLMDAAGGTNELIGKILRSSTLI